MAKSAASLSVAASLSRLGRSERGLAELRDIATSAFGSSPRAATGISALQLRLEDLIHPLPIRLSATTSPSLNGIRTSELHYRVI